MGFPYKGSLTYIQKERILDILKNHETLLKEILERFSQENRGKLPTYIPELSQADPACFAISLVTVDGQILQAGAFQKSFTIQSIAKPLIHGLALETHGREKVLSMVGLEPTGDSYDSIKLQPGTHRPYNPMVNAGALALASLIPGATSQDRFKSLQKLFERYTAHTPDFDKGVYTSEKKFGNHNRAMAYLLLNFDVLQGDVESILDDYCKECSFLVTSTDLAVIGATLANGGKNPLTQVQALDSAYLPDVLSVMFTCGMYDFAGEWAYKVGIPAKSGVSGGILGVVPGRMGIGVYSPLLDERGNSVRGIKAFKALARELNFNIFNRLHEL